VQEDVERAVDDRHAPGDVFSDRPRSTTCPSTDPTRYRYLRRRGTSSP
jgi:hypothetical protein